MHLDNSKSVSGYIKLSFKNIPTLFNNLLLSVLIIKIVNLMHLENSKSVSGYIKPSFKNVPTLFDNLLLSVLIIKIANLNAFG